MSNGRLRSAGSVPGSVTSVATGRSPGTPSVSTWSGSSRLTFGRCLSGTDSHRRFTAGHYAGVGEAVCVFFGVGVGVGVFVGVGETVCVFFGVGVGVGAGETVCVFFGVGEDLCAFFGLGEITRLAAGEWVCFVNGETTVCFVVGGVGETV